jgi:repressor of nif and glnA expression
MWKEEINQKIYIFILNIQFQPLIMSSTSVVNMSIVTKDVIAMAIMIMAMDMTCGIYNGDIWIT